MSNPFLNSFHTQFNMMLKMLKENIKALPVHSMIERKNHREVCSHIQTLVTYVDGLSTIGSDQLFRHFFENVTVPFGEKVKTRDEDFFLQLDIGALFEEEEDDEEDEEENDTNIKGHIPMLKNMYKSQFTHEQKESIAKYLHLLVLLTEKANDGGYLDN